MCPEDDSSATGAAAAVPAVQNRDVPGSVRTLLGAPVPETIEGTLGFVKQVDVYSEKMTAMCWWVLGELLLRLLALGVDDPVELITARTRYGKRALSYARAARLAFDQDRLQRLTDLGMTWTTLRELSSDAMEPHREHLLELFEAGRTTNTELLETVLALRKQHAQKMKAPEGEGGDEENTAEQALLAQTVARVSATANKLKKDVIESAKGFMSEGELAYALVAPDGSLRESAETKVLEMNVTLQKLVTEAVELIYRTSVLIVADSYPLQELADRIATLKGDFDAAATGADAGDGQPT
jgi:hypothetical protein